MAMQIKNILWPTDFSIDSLAALDCVKEFCKAFDANLTVMHVCPSPIAPVMGLPPAPATQWLMEPDELLKPANAQLKQLIAEKFDPTMRVKCEAVIGTAWLEVCNFAQQNKIDLIILATHGRTGLRHVLLGSVAERVVQHAPCPVLVVRTADVERRGKDKA